MRPLHAWSLLSSVFLLSANALVAQTKIAPETLFGRSAPPPGPVAGARSPSESPPPAGVFLYSLVVPGAGQYALGQRRWALYLATEALALGFFLDRRGAGGEHRSAYRDLAWETARSAVAPRTDPGFEYYERLAHWTRSGAFDLDPTAAGVQPETDPTTYNGSIWALAGRIFLSQDGTAAEGSPAHERALLYYAERAYPDALAWDWRGQADALRRFQELIDESDQAFREATVAAALLLTNHVLSATDAFVAGRLRALSGGVAEGSLRVEPGAERGEWRVGIVLGRSTARRHSERSP